MKTFAFPRQRRHTLYFLDEIRSISPVFIDTEIDMSSVQEHRRAEREGGQRISVVTYVVDAAARALTAHPQANVGLRGRLNPRVARYQVVNVKVTLDKTVGGQRVVLATVIPSADTAGLATIQRQIDHFKQGDPDRMPEFSAARLLHRLPWPIGRVAFSLVARSLRRRHVLLGTLAVTSLGHGPVDGFQSVGGTTVTLGVGRVLERPVARDGQVVVAPIMRLSLAFDHRAIDGAEAADLLSDIKDGLENFAAGSASSIDARSDTGPLIRQP
jgi:pyruvate/2-oxoglutarate dehydrogenase complex dihydrolipoamide acyltransferase (E2) component